MLILKMSFNIWLFVRNFSLHIKHIGKPVLSAMKANEFVHEALNVLCSSDTFLRYTHSWLAIVKLSF